jgi:glycosyltransferase involved in cell wall biosynthesis
MAYRPRVLVTGFTSGRPETKGPLYLRAGAHTEEAARAGVDVVVSGAMPPWVFPDHWKNPWRRTAGLALATLKRLWQAAVLPYRYDAVDAMRCVLIWTGPPVFERLFARRANFFIFELDDTLWTTPPDVPKPPFWTPNQAIEAAKRADRVIAGNSFLAEWARQYCDDVVIVPTTTDGTIRPRRGPRMPGPVRVGWTGTVDSWFVLDPWLPMLAAAKERADFEFHIHSHPSITNMVKIPAGLDPIITAWNAQTEPEDLLTFDIGVMPVPDNEWMRGKCGAKVLFYMAAGIPPIASPVGVNADIIVHGESGLLPRTEEEWFDAIALLVEDAERRERMGKAARARFEALYDPKKVARQWAEAITPPSGTRRKSLRAAFRFGG